MEATQKIFEVCWWLPINQLKRILQTGILLSWKIMENFEDLTKQTKKENKQKPYS